MLVGQMIVVSLQNGERHVGVVSAATMERDDLGLVLMMAQSMAITEDGAIQWGRVVPSLVVPGADLLEVDASTVKQSSPCLLYTSPSPRDKRQSRMPSSA